MGLPLLVSIRSESELPRLPTMRRIVASSAAVLVYVVIVATESGLRVEVLKAITSPLACVSMFATNRLNRFTLFAPLSLGFIHLLVPRLELVLLGG